MPVISIRVSDEWLARVDAAGGRLRWKRNAVIVNFVWDVLLEDSNVGDGRVDGEVAARGEAGRRVDGSSLPSLRKTEKPAKRLRAVHAVRDKLVSGGGSEQRPPDRAIQENAKPKWCPTSPCEHNYQNSFACKRANGGCGL